MKTTQIVLNENKAKEILKRAGIEITTTYLRHGKKSPNTIPYEDSTEDRAIYSVSLRDKSGKKSPWTFRFGQSIADSYKTYSNGVRAPVRKHPKEYDILATLNIYDPGIFDDFCDELGYNRNSIKAMGKYFEEIEVWEIAIISSMLAFFVSVVGG